MAKQLTEEQAKKLAALGKPMSAIRESLKANGYDTTQAEQAIITAQKSTLAAPAASAKPSTDSAQQETPQLDDWGLPPVSQEKFKDNLNPKVWARDLTNMGKGALTGVKNTASAMGNLVAHPLDTASNIYDAVSHPVSTAGGIASGAKNLVTKTLPEAWNDPEKLGELTGGALSLSAGGELGGLGKVAGEAGAIGKASGALKAAGIATKAVTTGVAAPVALAASDPSLKDKTPEQKATQVGEAAGAQAVGAGINVALGKGLGFADNALTGGKGSKLLPEDHELLNTAAGRASERLRAKGINTVGKLSPVDLAAYAVGKGVKFMLQPNGFAKNANTGRGDLVNEYAKQLEITKEDLTRLGYTDKELKALEAQNRGTPIIDALGHLAVEEITPEVIKASRSLINDRYQKFWDGKTVKLDGNGLSNMAGKAYGALRTADNVKQLDSYLEHAAPGLMAPNGKFIAQSMSGPEFQKMRSEISSMAHDLSSRINGPNASAADIKLKPVAAALHVIKDGMDGMADSGMSAVEKSTLKGLRKTYQAVSDFDGAMRENKLQGNVYMSPTDLLDYIRQSNPDRFTRTAPGDDTVQMGRDFDTLGIESKPRGLVTKYGQRRYAAGRNAVVNAAALQSKDDQ